MFFAVMFDIKELTAHHSEWTTSFLLPKNWPFPEEFEVILRCKMSDDSSISLSKRKLKYGSLPVLSTTRTPLDTDSSHVPLGNQPATGLALLFAFFGFLLPLFFSCALPSSDASYRDGSNSGFGRGRTALVSTRCCSIKVSSF